MAMAEQLTLISTARREARPCLLSIRDWARYLNPRDLEVLLDSNRGNMCVMLTPDEVLDQIVRWRGGIDSGPGLRALVSRVYGVEL